MYQRVGPHRRCAGRAVLLLGLLLVAITASARGTTMQFLGVGHGTAGNVYRETVLTLVNPGTETVEAKTSFWWGRPDADSAVPKEHSLGSHETLEILYQGDPARWGVITVEIPNSEHVISASAQLVTKPSPDSMEILNIVSMSPQEPTSKVVIPIRLDSERNFNTGVAIFYHRLGCPFFTLYNRNGLEIETRRVRKYGQDYSAMYVTEMFPEVLTGSFQGSLVIDYDLPEPLGFTAMALLDRGGLYSSVEVTPIDDEREYWIWLEPLWSEEEAETIPVEDRQKMWTTAVETLATTYGFKIDPGELAWAWDDAITYGDLLRAFALMPHEVSKAVERDARVQSVSVKHYWEDRVSLAVDPPYLECGPGRD